MRNDAAEGEKEEAEGKARGSKNEKRKSSL